MARSQRSLSLRRGLIQRRGGRADGEGAHLRHSAQDRRVAPRLRFLTSPKGFWSELSAPWKGTSGEDMVKWRGGAKEQKGRPNA